MLKNLSPRFIEELGSPNPQPFAILEIQSKGVSDEATTEAHWGANVGESNVDYTPTPPTTGDVILEQDEAGTPVEISPFFPEEDSGDSVGGAVFPASPATFFDKVDEDPNDGDTTYIYYNSPGGFRTFTFPADILLATDLEKMETIYSVKVITYAKGSVGSEPLRQILLVDGTGYDGSLHNVTTDYAKYENEWTQNPDGPTDWTRANLLDLTSFGFSSNLAGGQIRVTNCYIIVAYRPFEPSGNITVEHDLTGANIANDMIVSIDDNVPIGAGLTHRLFYGPEPTTIMRPTNHYDEEGQTVNEEDAYDGDDADASTTDPVGITPSFYIGRDSGNNDAWEDEPDYALNVFVNIVAERISGTGQIALQVRTSSGGIVNIVITNGGGAVSKQTFQTNVNAYIGDLADLRVLVFSRETGTTQLKVYDAWIEGSPLNPETSVSIQDGSQVPTLGFDKFRTESSFTSDGTITPVLKSIGIEIPDRIYRFTSRRGGIFGALPYLVGIPGRTISIDLKDFVTLGSDLKASLQKDESVVQMLRENYFKNLHASVQIGMYRDDITENDLAYTFQGKVEGYRPGMEEVSISLKDGTKDLSAAWPAGISIVKDGTHMVDVINTIMDDVGIASRYISRGSLDTLKATVGDGSPASSNYVVYRGGSPPVASGDTTLTEPETAKKVVGELLELLGAYMVSQEDGRIYVVEFDSGKASVGDPWTSDDFGEDPTYNPDIENIINDTFIYLDWSGEGTDAKDFANLETSPDNTSITNWGETNTRIIKSKWLAGSAADGYYGEELAAHIGARETERRKNGMGIFPCKTNLSKFEVQVGDMIDIDASYLIINPDVGEGDVRKFMAVNKDPDWENAIILWDLVEAR